MKLLQQWWLNGILFIIFLILLIFYLQQPNNKLLPNKNITEITIQRPEQENIILIKKQDNWYFDQPFITQADAYRVQELLKLQHYQAYWQTSIENINLQDFGLDPAQAIVFYNKEKVIFGHKHSLQQARYIQIKDIIYLIPDEQMPLLETGAVGLVSRKLVDEKPLQILINETPLPEELLNNWLTTDSLWMSKTDILSSETKIIVKLKEYDIIYYLIPAEHELLFVNPALKINYHFSVDAKKILLNQ